MSDLAKKVSYDKQFNVALNMLNPKQKLAVETIEGPVLVVAGPGTGKTQLLAARVGMILKSTDTQPRNILCLTFTDAGTVAMRNRLLEFIGPEAYNVTINTFHAFCNQIIKENIEFFGGYRDLQSISDLELVDVLHEIIDEFDDDHTLKRLKGDIYFDRARLRNLFQTMKQESWSKEEILQALEDYPDFLAELEDFQYKRKYKEFNAGDANPNKIKTELDKMKSLRAAVEEFENYESKMESRARFDYNDMLLWVLKQFKEQPDLLADYQERYQYILVDEYQDTNGAQNELLFELSSFWDKPNLFVVGDDDQSIYRFQGANMDNIVEFRDRYSPEIIVLENNYRSSQEILDRAKTLIDLNQERLVSKIPELLKELLESKDNPVKVEPQIHAYHNKVHEQYGVARKIIELRDEGVELKKIGVIFRQHKNASEIIKYLSIKNVPLKLKKKINALDLPETERLCNILRYLEAEYKRNYSGESMIFQILHYEYFNLKAKDIGKIALHCSNKTDDTKDDVKWREVLSNKELLIKIGVCNPEAFLDFSELIESWIDSLANLTLQVLFERIITEGNVIETIMNSSETAWRLQIVNTLFDLIKNETAKKPLMKLSELISILDKMEQADIDLPLSKITYAEDGVQFMTAHGSKGLEFEHVFLICANSNVWEARRAYNQSFSFPKNLVPASGLSDIEDDRRLFYVAMTRAESHLYISYAKEDENGKALEASRFVYEVQKFEDEIETKMSSDEDILIYQAELMKFKKGKIELIDHEMIDRVLENYKVSVTHLNKYLDCPLKFYFENILRVPMARSSSMGFGNAVHFALERFFLTLEENPERKIPAEASLIDFFKKGMMNYRSHFTDKEFVDLTKHGETCLKAYYSEYKHEWDTPKKYKPEHAVTLTEYKGIPITGKLDLVKIYDQHVDVYDYKTGKYKSDRLKPPLGEEDNGGDYWRQLVFYKMLLNGDGSNNWKMRNGYMDFVEPKDDKFTRKEKEISDLDIELVEEQLKSMYKGVKNHEFEKGCEKEDCKWCNFVKDNFVMRDDLIAYEEDEDY